MLQLCRHGANGQEKGYHEPRRHHDQALAKRSIVNDGIWFWALEARRSAVLFPWFPKWEGSCYNESTQKAYSAWRHRQAMSLPRGKLGRFFGVGAKHLRAREDRRFSWSTGECWNATDYVRVPRSWKGSWLSIAISILREPILLGLIFHFS